MHLMQKGLLWITLLALMVGVSSGACRATSTDGPEAAPTRELPAPRLDGDMALEAAIAERRSVRTFRSDPLTQEQIGQLLWATQGITDDPQGFRAAPSAGALYPLEIYVILPDGVPPTGAGICTSTGGWRCCPSG